MLLYFCIPTYYIQCSAYFCILVSLGEESSHQFSREIEAHVDSPSLYTAITLRLDCAARDGAVVIFQFPRDRDGEGAHSRPLRQSRLLHLRRKGQGKGAFHTTVVYLRAKRTRGEKAQKPDKLSVHLLGSITFFCHTFYTHRYFPQVVLSFNLRII